jgi:hypothetical protein
MTRRSPSATQRDSSTAPTTSSGTPTVADAPALAENRPTAEAAIRRSRGRSGGIVDAPGKKHRPPTPTDPGANRADSQAAKMRAAKTMVKTSRHRGRD